MQYLILGLLAAAMLFVGTPESNSPCVYKHDMITDFIGNNAKKRTCQEMFDEGNSRIVGLQTKLNSQPGAIAVDADTLTIETPIY